MKHLTVAVSVTDSWHRLLAELATSADHSPYAGYDVLHVPVPAGGVLRQMPGPLDTKRYIAGAPF